MTRYPQFFLCCLLGVAGCGNQATQAPISQLSHDQAQQQTPARIDAAQKSIKNLTTALENNELRHATLLTDYANILKTTRPELKPLLNNLAADASTQGSMFKTLAARLKRVQSSPELFASPQLRLQEAQAIIDAANPVNYNQSLADPVNVLADMSQGTLPRIDSPAQAKDPAKSTQALGSGSQLIGNPAYGQWVQKSNGMSLWEWYGMYSLFRDLTGGTRHSYRDWNRQRSWSYYNDKARKRFGDVRTRNQFKPTQKRYNRSKDVGTNRKSYGNLSKERRTSLFSKKTTKLLSKTASSTKKSSNFGGSFRSTFSRSRARFSGK